MIWYTPATVYKCLCMYVFNTSYTKLTFFGKWQTEINKIWRKKSLKALECFYFLCFWFSYVINYGLKILQIAVKCYFLESTGCKHAKYINIKGPNFLPQIGFFASKWAFFALKSPQIRFVFWITTHLDWFWSHKDIFNLIQYILH